MTKTALVVLAIVTAAVLGAGAEACGGNNAVTVSSDGGMDGKAEDGASGGDAGDAGKGSGGITGNIFNGDGGCLLLGSGCTTAGECCSNVCNGSSCGYPVCTSDNQACTTNGQCCSGTCTNGKCASLDPGGCKTLGNACVQSSDCCSQLCQGGVCAVSSFCGQVGDVCHTGLDCCGGICTIAGDSGASLGTCGQPPAGPANCTAVDGTVCGGIAPDGGIIVNDAGLPGCGGACCSRLCAPYGPTNVLVCQPASGCHVVGDLCMQDSDCCGSSGLPGGPNKPVTCTITPPSTVGVCRNPMGCKPDGDVCKLMTTSCNASCDCCSGNCETQDTCKQDNLGVPRCAGAACVDAGASCASSANCCNNMPCVPNPAFTDGGAASPFVCYGSQCVPKCGACTTSADCCPGASCLIPPASTTGTCGPCGGGGGTDGGGTGDAGTPQPDSGPPGCSLYGQECTTGADCCNGVPCSDFNGPCTGQTTCTCHFTIQ